MDAGVGLRLAGAPAVKRQEKIRWYVNPLFEPEEGDAPCMVEDLSLPIKKPVVPKYSAELPKDSARGPYKKRFNTLKCVECGATFKNSHAKHDHFRRGKCSKNATV